MYFKKDLKISDTIIFLNNLPFLILSHSNDNCHSNNSSTNLMWIDLRAIAGEMSAALSQPLTPPPSSVIERLECGLAHCNLNECKIQCETKGTLMTFVSLHSAD